MPKIAAPDFIASLDRIAGDISGFTARQVALRDTWYPVHNRLFALSGFAPNNMADRYVTNAAFMVWQLQDTRGPKHARMDHNPSNQTPAANGLPL
jgi:hypothetical protein